MKLIINNIEIELTDKQTISRTIQVNDILTLSDRQTNYTNTFSIKKTANNIKALELLGVLGATSFVPYEKNECYLYTDDGECMVYKGWCVVQSSESNEYKINVYDGNIDLYKAIENKNLGDLDLTEIDHTKNLASVVNTFTNNLNYKYLVADYNGEMVYNTNRINIDYLVPSAKVSYLWNKIFDTYGFTYSGSIFNTIDFTNLWLSYPKYSETVQVPTEIFNQTSAVESEPVFFSFIVPETGTYTIDADNILQPSITYSIFDAFNNYISTYTTDVVYIYINGVIQDTYLQNITASLTIGDVISLGYEIPNVNNGESYQVTYTTTFQSQLIISQYQGQPISFTNELKDFSIKDFIKEILNRFGVTPFKDKYTNHYTFKTLQELLQNNEVIDWSRSKNKFAELKSESYIFGSYAQQNKLTYKYNDTESDYYNSEILIDNVNLADNKVIVNSRIFAPEKEQTKLIHDLNCNVYKMWDKEVQDNGDVKYKGLQKRYYLMRENTHTFTEPTQIGSKSLLTFQNITTVPTESFYNLPMQKIVQNYYSTIGAILNYSKIVKAKIYLTEKNISDIDFSKLYWIKELNSYFLLNKVNNFIKKGITDVELIKVDYTAPFQGILLDGTVDGVKNRIPKLHFGFNQREITATAGTEILIYQDTIYNSDEYYVASLVSPGVTITQLALNIIKVSFATTGIKSLNITISNNDRSLELQSNTLTINII